MQTKRTGPIICNLIINTPNPGQVKPEPDKHDVIILDPNAPNPNDPDANDPLKNTADPTKRVEPTDPKLTPDIPNTKDPINPDVVIPSSDVLEAEIDGVTYIMDKDGNATLNGQIVYTKSQLIDPETEVNIINDIQTATGFVINDETGNPIEFSNDTEGLIAREKAVINTVKSITERQVMDSFFKNNPEFQQLLNYKKLNGSLNDFNFKKNYNLVRFIENDKENHKSLVREELKTRGLSAEDIDLNISALETTNKLSDRAKQSETYLNALDEKERLETENEIKRRTALRIEQTEKEYGVTINEKKEIVPLNVEGSIYDLIVAKGKIGSYVIPETGININENGVQKNLTRLDIFKYIAIATENGLSQAQIDDLQYNNNIENRLSRYLYNLLRTNTQLSSNKQVKRYKVATSAVNAKGSGSQEKLVLKYKID